MATVQPSPFDSLLEKLIGSQRNVNVDEQLGVTNLINQLMNGSSTTNNTQTTNADVSQLQKVFQQQQAGVTPDMLKAIFTEGAKAVPGLVASTANAVGARPGSNSALGTALTSLNSDLTSQAAKINQQMLADSGNTAGLIAQLTKSITDSGNTTQTQNTGTNQTQNSTKASDTVDRSTINTKSSAATAGTLLLSQLLGGGGSSLFSSIGNVLQKLIGGSGGGSDLNFNDVFNSNFGSGGLSDWWNSGGGYSLDTGYIGDIGTGIGGLFGFADGGIVPTPKLTLEDKKSKKAEGPSPAQLMALLDVGAGIPASLNFLGKGGGSGTGVPSNWDNLIGGGGVGSGGGTPDANGNGTNGNTAGVGPNISPTAALGLIGMITGLPVGLMALPMQLAQNVLNVNQNPTISSTPGLVSHVINQLSQSFQPATTSMDNPTGGFYTPNLGLGTDGISGGGLGAPSPTGSVSVGPATGVDAATGEAVGVSVDGPSSATGIGSVGGVGEGGNATSGGDNGVGGDGSGWANGGQLPKQANDPAGTKDTLPIAVSGGEYIMPTDVMEQPGMLPLMEMLRHMFHSPVKGA